MLCRVYWRNFKTGGLDSCIAKSLDVMNGETHPNGLAGWRAGVHREVSALCRLAGVQGVPGFRDLVTEPDGTMHIIMG